MMTSKDRKGPKKAKRFNIVEEPSNPAQPPKPMTNQPKRLHIYKPEDVRGNITGPFVRLSIGYKNYFFGFEINHSIISISLIFRHILFSYKPSFKSQ